MLFSIIIPVYKVEKYIVDCLESVRKQTFTDFEVIMVNDGSPDESPRICDRYARQDNRFQVIHKENGGLSSARNVGITHAKGDYIVFLDSDDLISDDALEKLSGFVTNKEDVVVTELLNVEDPNHFDCPATLYTAPSNLKQNEYLPFILKCKPNVQASVQYIVRRELFVKYRIHFEEGFYHEDNVYTPWLLSRAENFSFYTGVWYIRRFGRPDSITGTKNVKRVLDVIQLSAMYLQGSYFSHLEPNRRKPVNNSIVGAMWWQLYSYNSFSAADKAKIIETVKSNESVFRFGNGIKQRLMYCLCKTIGFDKGLSLLSSIRNR